MKDEEIKKLNLFKNDDFSTFSREVLKLMSSYNHLFAMILIGYVVMAVLAVWICRLASKLAA